MFLQGSAYVPPQSASICNHLGFRNVHLLSQDLRESVHEKRLSSSLSVNILNDFERESLADFACILSKEFLHLFECKIRQLKFVLDIERRDRAIQIELRDALNAYNTHTVGTFTHRTVNIDITKRMKETVHSVARNAIKLVNDEDKFLIFKKSSWKNLIMST